MTGSISDTTPKTRKEKVTVLIHSGGFFSDPEEKLRKIERKITMEEKKEKRERL